MGWRRPRRSRTQLRPAPAPAPAWALAPALSALPNTHLGGPSAGLWSWGAGDRPPRDEQGEASSSSLDRA